MKKPLLLIKLLLCSALFAQSSSSLKVSTTQSFQDPLSNASLLAMYTNDNGKTANVRQSKRQLSFEIFDEDLNGKFIKLIDKEKNESYVGDLYLNNQIKLFTLFAPKKDRRILYCYSFNIASKSVERSVLFDISVEKKQSLFGSRSSHHTSFSLSPNSEHFAIATDNITKNKNSYTIWVFNSASETLIYKKNYQESTEQHFEHNDLYIDDELNVYSLGKLFESGKSKTKRDGSANYTFILNQLNQNKTNQLEIELDEEHIQSLNMSKLNDELHLLGFYSNKKAGRIKGGCDFIIDVDNLVVKQKKATVLPDEVYQDLYGYRNDKGKNKEELKNFYIDHVLTDNEGSTYLIAEEFYITSTYVNNGMGGGYMQTTYNYDDLLILKFNSVGDLDWGRSIFKRSTSPTYNAFLKDDSLHLILNAGKNLKIKDDGRIKVSKGVFESTALYDIEFNPSGEVVYNKIQDNSRKSFFMPNRGTFEKNRFIMMSDNEDVRSFMILD